ncbi:MAG: hypothetical protein ACFFCW_29455 [Candidatus Hodarchaeota archaeon]
MANFDFYSAKAVLLRQRLQWIKDSWREANPAHNEIKLWIQERYDFFEPEISRIERLIQRRNPAYLPRIKTIHSLLEQELLSVSNYIGIMLREGSNETKMSKLIRRMCHESEFQVRDFLVTFTTLEGPAIIIGQPFNPIFYVTDESLACPYSWIAFFHEIGHVVVRHNREDIIESLIRIVRDHFRQAKVAIGPIDDPSRQRQEAALDEAEKYWTEGKNYLRLVELFCDCFAAYACGLAYLYFWLDHGISFEEHPKDIDSRDEHPPFFARFEACWHILPDTIKDSDSGANLKSLRRDYLSTSSQATNPELEYGTVCSRSLICSLADAAVEQIQRLWSSLSQWSNPPTDNPQLKIEEPLASTLNTLVFLLLHDSASYPQLEKRITQGILEK